MKDIITLGELLIDMTQNGTDEQGNGRFTAYPGGAPANVAVAAARLGAETGFIGQVGNDAFGRSLAETLRKEGVARENSLSTAIPEPILSLHRMKRLQQLPEVI